MKNYKYFFLIFIFISTGCVSTKNIEVIEKKKQEQIKKRIKIASKYGNKAYIDRDNKIRFLCMSNTIGECNYYSPEKHSYKNGTPQEEIITFNEEGYFPPISPFVRTAYAPTLISLFNSGRGVQCGIGSFAGWVMILGGNLGIKNYTKMHLNYCNSRFTKIYSLQLFERFWDGLLTIMTPFITGGTLHIRGFDPAEFKNAVYESNFETFKEKLLELNDLYDLHKGIDVIYLKQGDIKDDLEDKYELLLSDKSLKEGVIFLEEDGNRLLTIDIFKKYQDETLLKSISMQIEDILNEIAKNNRYVVKYEDILPYIPPKVQLPIIPPPPQITKDEFETNAQFEKRVREAVKKREEIIKNLQRKYSLAVFERNEYINNLEKAYQKYLEEKTEEKNELLKEIKENIPLLSKILFLENISGYNAKDFQYDAENNLLYFTIYSNQGNYQKKAVTKIPPEIAKRVKEKDSFKIIPLISAQKNKLILKGFKLLEPVSDNYYDVSYTNKNFEPEIVTLRVEGMKESIKKEISAYFKRFKQKETPIVDTTAKEIWYIDIVNTLNAKVPKWFEKPVANKIIGYGEGKTLEEAKAEARKELAYMIKVKIKSKFKESRELNNFKSFKDIKQSIQEATDIELNANDYKLYRQEKRDGIWYVGFEYKGKL